MDTQGLSILCRRNIVLTVAKCIGPLLKVIAIAACFLVLGKLERQVRYEAL